MNPNNKFSSKNICKILVSKGVITKAQATDIFKKKDTVKKKILNRKKKEAPALASTFTQSSISIIDVIVSLNITRTDKVFGILDEDAIYQILSKEWGMIYKKIDPLKLDLNIVTTIIPRTFAKKHEVLPIDVKNGRLTVAVSDPFNQEVIADISKVAQMMVDVVMSTRSDIVKVIDEFYGFKKSLVAAENQVEGPGVDLGNLEQYVNLKNPDEFSANDQHVVIALNHLLSYAFDQRASDIHIEPKRDKSVVRMRIDGVLHSVYELPKKIHRAIISRIKNLSRLDMAEKRKPQDGRIKTKKGDLEAEIRVSTLPVAFGEKVVMRIMDPEVLFQDVSKLGLTSTDMPKFLKLIKKPHGIILVCGPTGSGKSTTLYSTLSRISNSEINITTVEDPIEMIHEDFNQIAVNPLVGITFGNILRSILRQDPDVIMIGEMRDLETAENAIQAAMTGHLVLSTLHTNDAPSSVTRLLDLGVPSFLVHATLLGIIAQRLLRRICIYCREEFFINSEKLLDIGLDIKKQGRIKLHKGKGCTKCRNTGYLGRIAIFEILPVTDDIRDVITGKTDIGVLRKKAIDSGMVTLRQNAIVSLLEGTTTYQEVVRVTW